jgi:outer membrane protein insertion porin family
MSDMRYAKANYQIQQYIPLNKKYTIALNGELGWGKGLGGNPYPIFKNFYSGGLGSVRGFEQGSLGRVTREHQSGLGRYAQADLEWRIHGPVPGCRQ